MRILFIGQGPSKNHPPGKRPLEGNRGSGDKLAKMCGLTNAEFMKTFFTMNLFPWWKGKSGKGDKFPMDMAKEQAKFVRGLLVDYDRVILLGRNVAMAFGLEQKPILTWVKSGSFDLAVVPHPSGINRWYNDPKNRKKAERFLRKIVNDLPLQS